MRQEKQMQPCLPADWTWLTYREPPDFNDRDKKVSKFSGITDNRGKMKAGN